MPKNNLDKMDKKILHALQRNARLSNVDLAKQVGLSPSPCLSRVKALEKSGVIARHVTLLNAQKVDLAINVFIHVSLDRQSRENMDEFEHKINALPQVLECYLMTGDSDYLVRVTVKDVDALHHFILKYLSRDKRVSSIRSSLALKQIKYETALPIN